jgi:EAL domain-containing protein (putative c-di-GMP-specific phosphodiesterase class I)
MAGNMHESLIEMRSLSPSQQLTLEIHEEALTNVEVLTESRSLLRDLEINLAFDGFGLGQARLTELAEARPDCVKFDRSLIADIDHATPKQVNVVQSLVGMMREMNVTTLAVGVETAEEAATCRELGFDLAQGFYFGRPCPLPTPA